MTPLVSVICVANDAAVLERRLGAGLDRQCGVALERIVVENTGARFASAVEALEWGARRARGAWMLFVHQDVELLTDTWLCDAIEAVDPLRDLGWAGVAGVDVAGRFHGLIVDAGRVRGEYVGAIEVVQTLDECLLLCRRRVGPYFDGTLAGWHVYGVDACLTALRAGLRNVVVPYPVWHDSRGTNLAGLDDARRWILAKHGAALPRIATTTGVLPDALTPGGRRHTLAARIGSRVRADALRLAGWRGGYRVWLEEVLEAATDGATVDVYRPPARFPVLEARGFVHQPERARRVRHLFGAEVPPDDTAAWRVVWHDRVAAASDPVAEVRALLFGGRRALVVAERREVRARPELAGWLRERAEERTLCVDVDERRLAVYRIAPALP